MLNMPEQDAIRSIFTKLDNCNLNNLGITLNKEEFEYLYKLLFEKFY